MFQWIQGAWVGRAAGGKGSVVTPIQWVIGLLIGGLANASWYRASDWVLQLLGVLLVGMVLFFCVIYCVWIKVERDALRSESYSLRKREIDRGLIGDSAAGLRVARRRLPPGPQAPSEQ